MNNKRKSTIKNITFRIIEYILSIVLLITFFIILPGIAGALESHYSNTAIVTKINRDEILIEDTTGNIWSFLNDGYTVGDKVNVTWYDNHTLTREDDKIIKVKKVVDK